MKLLEAIRLFRTHYLTSKSPSYQEWMMARLGGEAEGKPLRANSLLCFLGDMHLGDITTENIQAWANSLATQNLRFERSLRPTERGGLSAFTIDGYRRAFSTFWKWLVRWPGIPMTNDVTTAVSWKNPPQLWETPPKAISDQAAEALLSCEAPLRDHAILRFLLFTGARVKELATLTLSRLSASHRHATLLGKGGKTRSVIFDPVTAEILDEYLQEYRPNVAFDEVFVTAELQPITTDTIRLVLRRMTERAGIKEKVSPHRLRHWWATKALASGANPAFVQDQMGHSDFNVTRRYARFSVDMLRQQYDQVFRTSSAEHLSGKLFARPKISTPKQKTPDDYRQIAQERGIEWCGPAVSDVYTKTRWRCRHSHEWEAEYRSVQQGSNCPVCAGSARKTSDEYHQLAREHKLYWLGPEVPNSITKTWWECKAEGHEWETTYASIQQGYGCPVCAGSARKTIEDYHTLAAERGWDWLGPELPPNVRGRTGWQCGSGHRWLATYRSIQDGSGCPQCAIAQSRLGVQAYHDVAQKHQLQWLGPEVNNSQTPTGWECSQGHSWQATYRCIHRGVGCPMCHGLLPGEPDRAKRGRPGKEPADYHALAESLGGRWLGESAPPNNAVVTIWELAGERWEASYAAARQRLLRNQAKQPMDYHLLAEKAGLRWLGPEVNNVATSTWWVCPSGHSWSARYNNIQQGGGCPVCARKQDPRRLSSDDYHKLAHTRGFEWIGREVSNSATKTTWRCDRGHEWAAAYKTIREGKGCPVCAGRGVGN